MTLNTTEKMSLKAILEDRVGDVTPAMKRRLRERGLLRGSKLTLEGMRLAAPEVGAVVKPVTMLDEGDRLYLGPKPEVDGWDVIATIMRAEPKPKTVRVEVRFMAGPTWQYETMRPKLDDEWVVIPCSSGHPDDRA